MVCLLTFYSYYPSSNPAISIVFIEKTCSFKITKINQKRPGFTHLKTLKGLFKANIYLGIAWDNPCTTVIYSSPNKGNPSASFLEKVFRHLSPISVSCDRQSRRNPRQTKHTVEPNTMQDSTLLRRPSILVNVSPSFGSFKHEIFCLCYWEQR